MNGRTIERNKKNEKESIRRNKIIMESGLIHFVCLPLEVEALLLVVVSGWFFIVVLVLFLIVVSVLFLIVVLVEMFRPRL